MNAATIKHTEQPEKGWEGQDCANSFHAILSMDSLGEVTDM